MLQLGSALVYGHSFVARLRKDYMDSFKVLKLSPWAYEKRISEDLRVNYHVEEVHLRGLSGANFVQVHLPRFPNSLTALKCVVLDLGTNDLAKNQGASWVVQNILDFSTNIRDSHKVPVVILSILPRCEGLRNVSQQDFNEQRCKANREMQTGCDGLEGVYFYRQKGFCKWQCMEDGQNALRYIIEVLTRTFSRLKKANIHIVYTEMHFKFWYFY